MAEKVMVKGNEAMGEAAVRSGCRLYFGYPITPQSEFTEYMARRLPEVNGTFLQSESEVSAVNMIYGAAATGTRVMTSTSSPGFSLMQEGVSYIAGAELPCVFVNVVRGGPGLRDIQPAQSDYFQATKGGGHGDYHMIVLAPGTIQESVDLIKKGFDLADKYRNPVMILTDGMLGQMMEPVEFPEFVEPDELPTHSDWALKNAEGENARIVRAFNIDPVELEELNIAYQKKYRKITENEIIYKEYFMDDAEYMFVGYGTMGRILISVIKEARERGIKIGLFRPISLWPFPYKELKKASEGKKAIINVEMSEGQMIEDVKLAIEDSSRIHFYGRSGGIIPEPNEILDVMNKIIGGDNNV